MALIDGSGYSKSVCEHAGWLANRSGGAVEIVHVLGRHNVSGEPENLSGNIGFGARTALLEELAELDAANARLSQQRGRVILDHARDIVIASGATKVTTRLRHGDIVETVEDLEALVHQSLDKRQGEIAQAEAIVEEEIKHYFEDIKKGERYAQVG